VGNNTTTTVLKTNALNSKYTLLLFYQSDCGHCKTAIETLITNYKDLVAKGIKIISIAGDLDPAAYTKTAATLPWASKYRDVEGMRGINFKNYGVIGTPTMYILDRKGIILSNMATTTEVLEFAKRKD
jgi:thiol-disulfide isomerase/thioredoxin